eukprot:TRINITY_DN1198_c3_g1_i1.p1 TRINITY_DN1198_c3_g1~~TRINITY_DN1198_c3_g1_i1.p1  ORF type:complete len:540 (+),score=99.37 TRINITY_DN1198_c3_g1_i1:782-2401(+)
MVKTAYPWDGVTDDDAREVLQAAWYGDTTRSILLCSNNSKPPLVNFPGSNGMQPLYLAARAGHVDTAKALLDLGAAIDAVSTQRATALYVASEFGRVRVVELLLNNGANVESRFMSGATPLVIASEQGHAHVVKLLLDKSADIEVPGGQGKNALHAASEHGHVEITSYILAQARKTYVDRTKLRLEKYVNTRDALGETALYLAARAGHLEIVNILLAAVPTAIDVATNQMATPLYVATEYGRIRVVEALLRHGANIDMALDTGATPLVIASQKGDRNLVDLLLDWNPDTEKAGAGHYNALHLASLKSNEVVELLLSKGGADPDSQGGGIGDNPLVTPLHLSLATQNAYLVSLLLKHGADFTTLPYTPPATIGHLFNFPENAAETTVAINNILLQRVDVKILPLYNGESKLESPPAPTLLTFNTVTTLKVIQVRVAKAYQKRVVWMLKYPHHKNKNTKYQADNDTHMATTLHSILAVGNSQKELESLSALNNAAAAPTTSNAQHQKLSVVLQVALRDDIKKTGRLPAKPFFLQPQQQQQQ